MIAGLTEAKSKEDPLDFLIGHDRQGSWFVVETHGLAGGYFRSELEAFKFVLADFRCRPKRIEVLADAVEPSGGTCVEVADRCRLSREAVAQMPRA